MIELIHLEPHPLHMHTVQELFEGRVHFVQLKPENQCGNNSRAGMIHLKEIQYLSWIEGQRE